MSHHTSIMINGVEVHGFNNGYDRWFFRKCDRSIEASHHGDGSSSDQFIGFRTTAANIRRRMADAGFSIGSCEHYFEHHKKELISYLEKVIEKKGDQHFEHFIGSGGSRNARQYMRFYHRFLSVIVNTSLADWVAAFPEAVILRNDVVGDDSEEPVWHEISDNPLVNAMLSYMPVNRLDPLIGKFNFPGPDWQQFTVAFLASCSDNVVCELNIAQLMNDDDIKSFQEHQELLREETDLHISCQESVLEIKNLSASQPENSPLQRMCYSSLITAMEAYLGDILKREIFSRPNVKQRFVASYEPFKNQKFKLSELYEKLSKIDKEIKDALDGLSLHKIDAAKNIFSNTLNTTFPDNFLPLLGEAVQRRHDIVHRNGKDKEGELISILHADVTELAGVVLEFTSTIDKEILSGIQQEIDLELDDDATSSGIAD